MQVGPRGRDQRSCTIWQHEHEQQFTAPLLPPQDLQGLTLEGVSLTHDGDLFGVTVEVVAMGIVSCLPLTRSTMSG